MNKLCDYFVNGKQVMSKDIMFLNTEYFMSIIGHNEGMEFDKNTNIKSVIKNVFFVIGSDVFCILPPPKK